MFNKKEKAFRHAAQRLFNTDDGNLVLAHLHDSYVKPSALGQTAEMTYYQLGQKELIQLLVSYLDNSDVIENIEVYSNAQDI